MLLGGVSEVVDITTTISSIRIKPNAPSNPTPSGTLNVVPTHASAYSAKLPPGVIIS